MQHFGSWALLLVVGLTSCGRNGERGAQASGEEPESALPPEQAVAACEAAVEFDGDSVQVGGTVAGVLRLVLPRGWHTYSDPPGDSGMPPSLSMLTGSGGELHVGSFEFPPPKTFEDVAGVTYGYEGLVELPFELALPETLDPGPLALKGTVQWLICRDICLPVESAVDARLEIHPPSDRTEAGVTDSVD